MKICGEFQMNVLENTVFIDGRLICDVYWDTGVFGKYE